MYCDQCGQQIDEDSRFCRHCGAKQTPVGPEQAPADRFKVVDLSRPNDAATAPASKKSVGAGWFIASAVLVLLLLIGVVNSPTSPSMDVNQTVAAADAIADNIDAEANTMANSSGGTGTAPEPAAADNWTYRTDDDKVRGGTSYFAAVTSTNSIHQDPPYDSETTMRMTVRKHPAYGTDVVLTISSGQMMCPSYEGCSGTVRFDNGPAQHIRFSGPEDNSSDTIFVNGAKSFIAKLKGAKKVVIEKTLYEAGVPVFEFDVHGLKWDR